MKETVTQAVSIPAGDNQSYVFRAGEEAEVAYVRLQNEQVFLERKTLDQIEKKTLPTPIVAFDDTKSSAAISDTINVAQNGIHLLLASDLNEVKPNFRNQSRLQGLKDRISLTPFYGHSV